MRWSSGMVSESPLDEVRLAVNFPERRKGGYPPVILAFTVTDPIQSPGCGCGSERSSSTKRPRARTTDRPWSWAIRRQTRPSISPGLNSMRYIASQRPLSLLLGEAHGEILS
ncbi:hypothetical protein LshimejAT787_0800510 [Lyophyllum shimeji]|uniref:Uncharacterized protein n=1 Tax=Lyophyllum shimeji TaxID=47721 RepID=A0A9P3UQH3_LYOSH|nr:hypothetical protein LshimejAT787_0800510 [Lyophyllum shimeji]